MNYPPLISYGTEAEFRAHFINAYCHGPIVTFDGIGVRFRASDFDHCCFDTVASKDDTFSTKRAERIDWIKAALQDPTAELYVGWDNRRKKQATNRRVAIVCGNYVVVIRLLKRNRAVFVTAFAAGTRALSQIRTNPKWTKA